MKQIILISLLVLASCKKQGNILYHYDPDPQPISSKSYAVRNLEFANKVDIVWVIDNSGSMGQIQNNVIKNSRKFLDEFASNQHIDWKMGLVSTDMSQKPFLGFEKSFDASQIKLPSDVNIVSQRFQDSVRSLGTHGSGAEYTFYNLFRHIKDYDGASKPSFLRDNAYLAVIMVTDEPEQSQQFGAQYEPLAFLNAMAPFVDSVDKMRFYGAFQANDLKDCRGGISSYKNSRFKKIIDASEGFAISACDQNFGTKMASISEDIISLIQLPSILLNERPRIETLEVSYKGQLLPIGREEDGGMWYYSSYYNTVNFYSMEFVEDFQKDSFKITFEVDDGIWRPEEGDDSYPENSLELD